MKDTEAEVVWSYAADARSNILELVVGPDSPILDIYFDIALADFGDAQTVSVPGSLAPKLIWS